MIEYAYGFPGECGSAFIPYCYSIILFWNLQLVNYSPRSNVMSIGHKYLANHVIYIKFTIVIYLLFLYWIIPNHTVMGYIIVADFNIKDSFPFLHILRETIRYTQSLFQGILSTNLSENLLYLFVERFVR